MKTMHLFAGAGGGLLADLILGHTPIVAVEIEKYACEILRKRASEGWFPELAVWEGDVREFNANKYTGVVDCIHAGFSCQDISAAGNQAGIGKNTRSGLYREVLRIASIVRPRIIFLENVAAITSRTKDYLKVIAKDLFEIGYDAQWLCLSAADVGANHKRERWWCLCTNSDRVRESQSQGGQQDQRGWAGNLRQEMADAESKQNIWLQQPEFFSDIGASCEQSIFRENRVEKTEPRLGGMANGLADRMDGNWWELEPNITRTTTIIKNRSVRLKALGNGQVPLQAATAFNILYKMVFSETRTGR